MEEGETTGKGIKKRLCEEERRKCVKRYEEEKSGAGKRKENIELEERGDKGRG